MRASAILLLLAACGPVGARDVERRGPGAPVVETLPRTPLVVVERGGQGSRLVMVDEEGLRQRVLTDADATTPTLDLMPAWSPDGHWIVFASSRERGEPAGRRFSLWIIAADKPDAHPVRLTSAAEVDWTPTFTRDGRAIVFASTGDSGSFDLWRLELEPGTPPHPGKLTRLTSAATEDKDPAFSPDGRRLAYTAIDGERHRVMLADADGANAAELIDGDEPSWSPDGRSLLFVAPASARDDLDVWRIRPDGGGRVELVDDDVADEHTPRLSADGCWLFATSLLRNQAHDVVTSTLVVASLCARSAAPRWQALVEVHPTPRMGVALAPVPLRADVLARAPAYKAALKRALLPGSDEE